MEARLETFFSSTRALHALTVTECCVNDVRATNQVMTDEDHTIKQRVAGVHGALTVYRLVCYQPEESRATLSAQHASKEHHMAVHTLFVEPFNPIIGAQYIVLGEIENAEGVGAMVRARVLNCVDGVNVALLQKAIDEQRSFFREREHKQGDAARPAS